MHDHGGNLRGVQQALVRVGARLRERDAPVPNVTDQQARADIAGPAVRMPALRVGDHGRKLQAPILLRHGEIRRPRTG